MASVRSIDDALSISLNTNGRVLRNLIHGADTVMSHILHFYHLSAADFVNVSPANGVLGSPWDDGSGGNAFGTMTTIGMVDLLTRNPLNGGVTKELVESYVEALNIRKDAHSMGAIFSGRQPTSNAIVPGGVTTIFNQADIDNFKGRLGKIRNFINRYYIPDVVFVATRTQVSCAPAAGNQDWTAYWGVGTNPGYLLSYGEYPDTATSGSPFKNVGNADMLIARGLVDTTLAAVESFNPALIKEYVNHSYYSSADGLNPSVGATTPLAGTALSGVIGGTGTQYSWLKAPRYNGKAAEVGPLARMAVSYVYNRTATVSDTSGGVTPLNSMLNVNTALPAAYKVQDLVGFALKNASFVASSGTNTTAVGVANLFSPLGRHACRALECKLVADAMDAWVGQLTLTNQTTDLSDYQPYTTSIATGSGYVYKAIPKATVAGIGLAEAPRGALGHWITIQSKKIANYQCVVPSTWNACPQGGPTGTPNIPGPAESVLSGLNVGTGTNDAICNIARMLHPYDFCIACAVHVVTPEGKDVAKFEMGLEDRKSVV